MSQIRPVGYSLLTAALKYMRYFVKLLRQEDK